ARFDLGGAPWARLDGVLLAESTTAFAAGTLIAPLNVTAAKAYVGHQVGVTGAATPGTPGTAATTCVNWTRDSVNDLAGTGYADTLQPFSGSDFPCNGAHPLYCMER